MPQRELTDLLPSHSGPLLKEFSLLWELLKGECRFDTGWVGQLSFMEIDDEIFSLVILSLTLIQEEQLSVSGKRMCTSTG